MAASLFPRHTISQLIVSRRQLASRSSAVWVQIKAGGAPHWSLAQRTAAIGRNGAKLLAVGFFASLFGVTITNGIVEV